MRRAARIDQNQPALVKEIRGLGITVQPLHAVGSGCPDLLLGFRGKNYLLEVKNPEKPLADRQLTPDQVKWHAHWSGQVAVIETFDDVINFLKGMEHDK